MRNTPICSYRNQRGPDSGKPLFAYVGFEFPHTPVLPPHWANFIHSIKHRTLPISDVHSHMKMLNVCHLAGICCRLGRTVHWDQATEMITGDDLAAAMMSRQYREAYRIEM